ncbi:MAG: hypothetical protein RLZZ179_210 [Verrucomicrobiota bacterium]
MDSSPWIAFFCRGCREPIRISRGMAGRPVICPLCRTKVTAPHENQPGAVGILAEREASSGRAILPAGRQSDPSSPEFAPSTLPSPSTRQPAVPSPEPVPTRAPKAAATPAATPAPTDPAASASMKPPPPAIGSVQTTRSLQEGPAEMPDLAREHLRELRKSKERAGRQPRKHHRQRDSFDNPETSASSSGTPRWLLAASGIGIAGLTGAVAWFAWKSLSTPPPSSIAILPDRPAGLEVVPQENYAPELLRTIRQFLTAPDIDAALPFLRDRPRVEPAIRRFYSAEQPWKPMSPRTVAPADVPITPMGRFAVARIPLEDFSNVLVAAEQTSDGFRIDWESFAAYGEMPWDDFMAKQPRQPVVMRVVIRRSQDTISYGNDFPDRTQWESYQLNDGSGGHILSGYAAKNSPADVLIQQALLVPGSGPRPSLECLAIVKLRYPENSSNPREVEIAEFIERGWILRGGHPITGEPLKDPDPPGN